MRFPAGSLVLDHAGMGRGRCTCVQDGLRLDHWYVSSNCIVHCTTATLANESNPLDFTRIKPVQLTVNATYYEKAIQHPMPTFMHYQCACERVDYSDEREDNVFKVVSGCRMHDPASNYQGNSFPVAKTVMK